MGGETEYYNTGSQLEHAMDPLLSLPRIPMKSNFSLHSFQGFSTLSRRRDAILHDGTAVSLENITGRLTESVLQPNTLRACFRRGKQTNWLFMPSKYNRRTSFLLQFTTENRNGPMTYLFIFPVK